MATQEIAFHGALLTSTMFDGSEVDEVVIDGKAVWNSISYSYPSQLQVVNYTGLNLGFVNGTYDISGDFRIQNGQRLGGFNLRPYWIKLMITNYSIIYWCAGDSNWKMAESIDPTTEISRVDDIEPTHANFLRCGTKHVGSTANPSGEDPGPISPELGSWWHQFPYYGDNSWPVSTVDPFFVFAV